LPLRVIAVIPDSMNVHSTPWKSKGKKSIEQ